MERTHCPAPLPEEPAGPILTKMLVPAPYEAPKKEDPKKVKKTRSGLRRRDTSDKKSKDSSGHPSSEDEEEEEEDESPIGEGRKGRLSHPWRPNRQRGGKVPSRRHPPRLPIAARSGIPGPRPW